MLPWLQGRLAAKVAPEGPRSRSATKPACAGSPESCPGAVLAMSEDSMNVAGGAPYRSSWVGQFVWPFPVGVFSLWPSWAASPAFGGSG